MASPKNCSGVRPVRRLVPKKRPMIGRVVATPNAIATIRITHWRCSSTRPLRMCHHALPRQNKKTHPKSYRCATLHQETDRVRAQPQSRKADHQTQTHNDAAAPTMQSWIAPAQRPTNCGGIGETNSKLGIICISGQFVCFSSEHARGLDPGVAARPFGEQCGVTAMTELGGIDRLPAGPGEARPHCRSNRHGRVRSYAPPSKNEKRMQLLARVFAPLRFTAGRKTCVVTVAWNSFSGLVKTKLSLPLRIPRAALRTALDFGDATKALLSPDCVDRDRVSNRLVRKGLSG
jgi:hypothetical protein